MANKLDIRWTGLGHFHIGSARFHLQEGFEPGTIDLYHETGGSSSHSVELGNLRSMSAVEATARKHAERLASGGNCY